MKQSNVRGTNLRNFWRFFGSFVNPRVDSQLFPKAVRKNKGRKERSYRRTGTGKGEGNSRSGKDFGRTRSSVGKGERGITEICDQIHSTADELLTRMNR